MSSRVAILLKKADSDLKAVENLLKCDDSPVDVIAFHIQLILMK